MQAAVVAQVIVLHLTMQVVAVAVVLADITEELLVLQILAAVVVVR
jgi:hypothetical protein